jgi:hypothetical protein
MALGSQFRQASARALQTFRCANGRERVLRYTVSRRDRQHRVVIEYPVLERSKPEVFRVDSVEEARCYWRGLRDWLRREGYEAVGRGIF